MNVKEKNMSTNEIGRLGLRLGRVSEGSTKQDLSETLEQHISTFTHVNVVLNSVIKF